MRLAAVLHGMALEVDLSTFWNQALTTFLAAAFDAISTCLCGHTSAETVLLFTGAFGWLVGAKAHGGSCKFVCAGRGVGAGL